MKVLVTGGSGYLGRAIVSALLNRGHAPVAFSRRATTAGLPCPAIDGDVCDRASVMAALRGMDGVVHSAALVSIWRPDPSEFPRINAGAVATVLDAAAASGIARIVATSSFLALPPAGAAAPLAANDYQRSKVLGLDAIRSAANRGVPVVTVVPGVIYGPGIASGGNLLGRLIRDHLAGRLPGLVGADRVWSFSFVDDVADAHVRALEAGQAGQEYLAGGENASQMRAFELLRDARGTRLPRRIPAIAAYALGWFEEQRARLSPPPLLTRGTVRILTADWPLDSRRSVRELSYRITPLETGMNRLLAGVL